MALLTFIFLLLIDLVSLGRSSSTNKYCENGSMSVSGMGSATAPYNIASFFFTVKAYDISADSARIECAKNTQKLIDTLKDVGIPNDKIVTQRINLRPEYKYPKRNKHNNNMDMVPDGPILIGYHLSNTVDVTIEDLSLLSKVMDKVVSLIGDHVIMDGPNLGLSPKKQEEVAAKALEVATANAIKKAEIIAKAANCKINNIIFLGDHRENNDNHRPQFAKMARGMEMAAMSADVATPIMTEGIETVSQQVFIEFGIV